MYCCFNMYEQTTAFARKINSVRTMISFKKKTSCGKTLQLPKETVEAPKETCGNTRRNGRKQLGNWTIIALRESPSQSWEFKFPKQNEKMYL